MKGLYEGLRQGKDEKKKWIVLAVVSTLASLCALLLIFFLHPRSKTWAYFGISLPVVLLMVGLDYYFLFYRLARARALGSFFKTTGKRCQTGEFAFQRKGGDQNANRLEFLVLYFESKDGESVPFLLLKDVELPLEEGQTYIVSYDRRYIMGLEEKHEG